MLTNTSGALPQRTDVLIIGAGAVGLTMAQKLVTRGKSVTVVEGGGERIDRDHRERNAGILSGRFHAGLSEGRYQGFGGTTRLWGGQLMPFYAVDFEGDPALNKPTWPVRLSELLRFEGEALRLLGIVRSARALEQEWREQSRWTTELDERLQVELAFWVPQPDFTQLFGRQLRSRDGPMVLLEHRVDRIECDEASGRVTGVSAVGPEGRVSLQAQETVLCCGVIETSRLLLRAQAALPNSPLARNSNVGRWFLDHLHARIGLIKPADRATLGQLFDTIYARDVKITPKVRLRDNELRSHHLANCAGTIDGPMSLGEIARDVIALGRRLTHGGGRSSTTETFGKMQLLAPLVWAYLSKRRSHKFLSGDAFLGVEVEQIPTRESYIALEAGVPAEVARVDLHWNLDGREIEAVDWFCRSLAAFCESHKLGNVECDPRISARDAAFLNDCRDANHHTGGARMGASADDGVVDRDLRVFGMSGLSVAGASTFPTASFANPTFTAILLGLRLAESMCG